MEQTPYFNCNSLRSNFLPFIARRGAQSSLFFSFVSLSVSVLCLSQAGSWIQWSALSTAQSSMQVGGRALLHLSPSPLSLSSSSSSLLFFTFFDIFIFSQPPLSSNLCHPSLLCLLSEQHATRQSLFLASELCWVAGTQRQAVKSSENKHPATLETSSISPDLPSNLPLTTTHTPTLSLSIAIKVKNTWILR